jgi:repressor LexA
MKELHHTQRMLLNLLKEHLEAPLTIRELQSRLGVSSPSVIYHHILQLEKKGLLKRDPINPSNYLVTSDEPEKQIAYLPLYGPAYCSPNGSILDGSPIGKIPVSTVLISFPPAEAFLVKAKGDSMSPRINDGDFVLARRMTRPIHGEIMVCVNNEEAIIKRIAIEKGNTVILYSVNPDPKYSPFTAAPDFRVEGIVKGLLSKSI